MRKIAFILCALCLLSACSWFKSRDKDNLEPPSELKDFEAKASLEREWSRSMGSGAGKAGLRLRPQYSGGVLYVSDVEGTLRALDARSGQVMWEVETEQALASGAGVGDDGSVAVGTLDGQVLVYETKTGQERWRAQLSSEVLAPPAIEAGVLVARAQDGRVYGLQSSDGKRLWVFDQATPLLTLRGNGAPQIHDGTVYLGYDNGKVVALNLLDGTLRWEQSLGQSTGRTELERISDVDGELAWKEGNLFAANYRGQIAALAGDSGRLLWSRDFSAYAGVSESDGRLFGVNDTGEVWAFDALSGTSSWKQDGLMYRWLTAPATFGAYVVVGDFEGYIHVLSSEDGALVARVRVGKSPLASAPVVADDRLYAFTQEGDLVSYRLQPSS